MKSAGRNKSFEIAMIGMLSAIAFVLEVLNISLLFMPAFIKLDLSDLPALIASMAMGPLQGIMVCLIKNIFHLLYSTTGGVGELCNFLLGAVFVGIAGGFHRRGKKAAVTGGVAAAIVMALFSVVLNYYLVYPVYMKVMEMSPEVILGMYQVLDPSVDSLQEALLKFNMPFTFCKAILSVWLGSFVYKRILPMLRGIILNKS